jgi:hypothetical protein
MTSLHLHPLRWLRFRFLRLIVKAYRQRPFSRAAAMQAENRRLRQRLVIAEDRDRRLSLLVTRERLRADWLADRVATEIIRAQVAERQLERVQHREFSGAN